MQRLLPHIQRALQLRRKFVSRKAELGFAALETDPQGTVILGPSGRVVFANGAAGSMASQALSVLASPLDSFCSSRPTKGAYKLSFGTQLPAALADCLRLQIGIRAGFSFLSLLFHHILAFRQAMFSW